MHKLSVFAITQGVTLEGHSVECVTSSSYKRSPSQTVSSGGVVKLMSFTAFSAASVKSKVRFQ